MTALDIHIGKRLRQLRIERGMTPEMLAARLQVSPQKIADFESGTH